MAPIEYPAPRAPSTPLSYVVARPADPVELPQLQQPTPPIQPILAFYISFIFSSFGVVELLIGFVVHVLDQRVGREPIYKRYPYMGKVDPFYY